MAPVRLLHRPFSAQMYDLTCVIHVHSTFSDGTATIPEILDAGRKSGAEAVLLTDHDSLEAARRGWEGWHEGVLLLVGHEVTTRGGHLLAFDTPAEIEHSSLTEEEICARLQEAGGFGFAAHPFSRGGLAPSIVRPHPWSALTACPRCGVEVWSVLTDAAERWRTPQALWRFLRDPVRELEGPPPENLAQWDRLCAGRRVPAVGGLDAHQSGLRIHGRVISPMPHDRYFRLVRTHVLLDAPPRHELAPDRQAVYSALKEGRCHIGFDAIADSTGFQFWGTRGGALAMMGAPARGGGWTLQARAPSPANLRLLRDGELVCSKAGNELACQVDRPGSYRIEARRHEDSRRRTWIVSNPIYLLPEEGEQWL